MNIRVLAVHRGPFTLGGPPDNSRLVTRAYFAGQHVPGGSVSLFFVNLTQDYAPWVVREMHYPGSGLFPVLPTGSVSVSDLPAGLLDQIAATPSTDIDSGAAYWQIDARALALAGA